MNSTAETGVIGAAEMRMRNVLRAIAAEKIAPVALYGAGAHTAKVIAALLESPVSIAGFVDESRERRAAGVCGWPVVAPGDVERLGARAVVINTDRHERRIWAGRRELEAKGLRVFRLYPELEWGQSRVGGVDRSETSPCRAVSEPAARDGAAVHKLSHGCVQEYWRSRGDADARDNAPIEYLGHVGWSVLVGEWLAEAGVPREARIVELGCNVGRNLAWLRRNGWSRLAGVELNPRAVSLMHAYFPVTAAAARVDLGTMEEVLPKLPNGAFDVCLTMAVFMCVHPSAAAVFGEVSRVTRTWILTVEDERNDGERYFPRNYRDVFGRLGWREARALAFSEAEVETGRLLGLQAGYVMRLLERE